MTRIRIQVLALVALASTLTYAQQDNKKGYLTGSFETNTIYYKDDSKTKAESPEDHFGSNNYLKLDYYQGKFAVGGIPDRIGESKTNQLLRILGRQGFFRNSGYIL